MSVSRVLAMCGLAAGVSWAVAAQPQTPPKSSPNVPSSSSPKTPTSKIDESSLLKQMEGRWMVEVTIDPAMWNPHLFKDSSDRTGTDPNRPATSPNTSPSNTPATSPTDTRDPAARTPDSNSSGNLSKAVTGYSNVQLILGERVLQETTVLPDMKAKMERTTDRTGTPKETPGSASGNADDEKFRGVSLLAFDENTKTYSMVFADNCQGGMRFSTGSYDAGTNRIVFHSASHGPAMRGPGWDGTSKDGTSKDGSSKDSPSSRTGAPGAPDQGHRQDLSGVRVVLEFVSPDEHRVTMYANAMPMSSDRDRTTPSQPNGTPKESNPSSTDRTAQPTDHAGGMMVYRAVYKRATGGDLDKVRDALRVTDATDK